jgi:hypothetical protein
MVRPIVRGFLSKHFSPHGRPNLDQSHSPLIVGADPGCAQRKAGPGTFYRGGVQKQRQIIALASWGTYLPGGDWFTDRRRAMTKKEIGAAEMQQPADDISWRHFWLANVVLEIDRRPAVRIARPALRPRKDSLSHRLQRLRHMRAVLGASRH